MNNGHFFDDLSVGQTVAVRSLNRPANRARVIEGEIFVLVPSRA